MNPSDLERFWSKVEKTGTCWNWTSHKIRGYGQFYYQKKVIRAHRFSYQVFKGEIPLGFQIDHLCKNVGCVNPEHLEAVTQQVNLRRGENTFQGINSRKTHCIRGHELTPENLASYELSKGIRLCKKCIKIRREIRENKRGLKNAC